MASPACTLYSLHPYPALLQCATSCYNKNNNLQKKFLLGHSFFTPPKRRLVLCDSDDGFFLEGESQNVAHDYYCSTSIYLVWISWHLLTFTITPTPSWIKKLLGRWRHSTEFRSGFGSKSRSTSVMVLIYLINLDFCTWGKDQSPSVRVCCTFPSDSKLTLSRRYRLKRSPVFDLGIIKFVHELNTKASLQMKQRGLET